MGGAVHSWGAGITGKPGKENKTALASAGTCHSANSVSLVATLGFYHEQEEHPHSRVPHVKIHTRPAQHIAQQRAPLEGRRQNGRAVRKANLHKQSLMKGSQGVMLGLLGITPHPALSTIF